MVTDLMDSSCRVAFTAYLHDIGKFAERAKLAVAAEKLEIAKQLHCPRWDNRYSHIHAAYTSLAFEQLEKFFPETIGNDVSPFGAWRTTDVDDSLINAAANHHKPETYLQWIIATADRLASGFEREDFEQYNAAEDRPNYIQTRLHPLFEVLQRNAAHLKEADYQHRYPLAPLSVNSLFPVDRQQAEPSDKSAAVAQYHQLWQQFCGQLEQIPSSHRRQWPLWLDHFDTLWQTFTHAIPSATAGKVIPDVSLYDHSKTTAALAVALWRYHEELGHDQSLVATHLKQRAGEHGWGEQKLLLIQGDFFGIQEFIFAGGAETQKKASKLLRGRSFYVSLLTEIAALKVLDALQLPCTSQVINAAGKFLIVAPNTPATIEKLNQARNEINHWFMSQTYGQASIGLAALAAAPSQFISKTANDRPFKALLNALFRQLEVQKFHRFGLLSNKQEAILAWAAPYKVCRYNNRLPAAENGVAPLSADQIEIGRLLTQTDTLLLSKQRLPGVHSLTLPMLGYWVSFSERGQLNQFAPPAQSGELRRCFDISLPQNEAAVLFNGFSRRNINAYVARFKENEISRNGFNEQRYGKSLADDDADVAADRIKTLNHLACEDKWQDADSANYLGIEALATLKGDVDNLGAIFQDELASASFARMAGLSRQMNNFFAVYLPWLCMSKYPNTYTIFAGGDDFLLMGAWRSQLLLANSMRQEFHRYVAGNSLIHFSAGMFVSKPGTPISYLGSQAEELLSDAKSYGAGEKNAVACFGKVVGWKQFAELLQAASSLRDLRERYGRRQLSTAYWYDVLQLSDLSAKALDDPKANIWRSRLGYRTFRTFKTEKDKAIRDELMQLIGGEINRHRDNYRIALTTFIYTYRK
ncbi:type III-A CRISPR-associated protein Cas10/Csm1 [Shewanella sp. 4t3-1-2LB]|uniref:type III-A CRISPR-associated protein Cas10/Csm1 n=1 Tax=Shewanella sp. 4t3-1-2LB TaxID=2817682 RepID=UPI001A989002|nr:type III-A CRISPR-associated protein Cas10/Csm1 [Shewanella sp. 4t3-1-2LB]MBO1270819.1 type III-A CRISPR-associated protein Cas10/Csm1 [Shewanella sp. 4t3-1-2LB]